MSTEVFLTLAVAFYTAGLLHVPAVRDRVECRYREGKTYDPGKVSNTSR